MRLRIVVIGAGFGGSSVMRYLRHYRRGLELTVIDKSRFFSFLPALPDVLGRKVDPQYLSYPVARIARECGAIFVNAAVQRIDPARRTVITETNEVAYDYLVIASGSESDFYGNELLRSRCRKLDNVADARQLRFLLDKGEYNSYIIAGGGYTGIEIAAGIRRYLMRRRRFSRVFIAEKTDTILGALPSWMKEYAGENLKRMQVPVIRNTEITGIEKKTVYLSSGDVFEDALPVWAAGVRTPGFLQSLGGERNMQGRMEVDRYLRLDERCFVIGDSAQVAYRGGKLRMGVQFAVMQGVSAARNIVHSITKQPLVPYRPLDLGYIVPMANNNSCGRVLGVDAHGVPATFLHYVMCLYRSYGMRNKWGLLKGII
ncbi:MAG: FAD-dependent oxidoreductase [Candidatus Omnitrophica bacterium]|nr:FAD-dependent oxidoreductase [Candidatus Omnitrophota bacterium]